MRPSWPRVKLGEVCEEIRDRVQSAKVSVDCYVTTDNMLQNCAGIVLAEYVPKDVGLVRYQSGDVLLANIRPYLRKLWLSNRDGGCSSDVIVFRSACQGLSPDYLFAALSQDRFFDYVMKKPRGTKMPRGDRDWMKQFEFPLPPLSVQHSIVERLERELGAVDKLAKKFEELEIAAEAEFKAELKETFERFEGACGGRGATALPAHGRARAPREPQASAVRRVKLGDVCELISGFAFRSADYSTTGKYRVVNIGCVQDDWFDEVSSKRIDFIPKAMPEHCRLTQGDLLMSLTGNIGRLCYVTIDDGLLNQRVAKIVPMRSVEKTYLCYLFRSPDFAKALTDLSFGAAQLNISPVKMREISLPLPPLAVQRTIVARLDAAKAKKEALVSAAKCGRETAALWRKAILKEAFE